MKKILVFALSLAAAGLSFAAQPLLTPAELKPLLGNPSVRVIDIRDPKSYAGQHIPGAVNAPYGKWRGPATNPGELPELPKLTALVQSLGLTPATHAVVVSSGADSTDFGASARVYWTLKVLGLKELSILNGGVKGWAQAGLPQDNAAVTVAASTYAPQLDASLIASREQVAQKAANDSAVLVDARPADFFLGETRHQAAKLPGTLEGAVNVEHSRFFNGNSAVFVPEKARQASSSIDATKEAVAFCNTGHWAATDWFALSEIAGHKNVKLYPGSMVDWTQDAKGLPMSNVPGRAKQLLIDARLWSERTF
ncbi:sulfurtransferase [Ramlibacter sp. RBP-2]|uniref:Sulfurtransferase n=1 Tax=Ramlibacter lithotrophicus TaxID=2606681 RepID=A0A7X6DCU8_9BURK|nr:rhodanese-like domain-containing protein [Ramlibacter lithotrophicus]NKE64783.1 sulfurtransferase [Ramlibacter lithotrophicus]